MKKIIYKIIENLYINLANFFDNLARKFAREFWKFNIKEKK